MKSTTKKVLALLLVICTLVSVTMPTVFANSNAAAENSEPPSTSTEAPAPVVYQFYISELANQKLYGLAADIKASYDAGERNWRYEGTNYSYQMQENKTNGFASGTQSLEYLGAKGKWIAVRIQAPGAGKYDLTYVHGAKNQGAKKGSLYIVKASVIDEALGENAATYAENIAADPYTANGTDAYTQVTAAIEAAIANQESVIDSDYSATSATIGVTDTGSFVFEAETEYVLVFKAIETMEGTSTARLLLSSLTATYAEDQSGDDVQGGEDTREPVSYQFADINLKNELLLNLTAGFKAAYDAGTQNWRYEAASSTYQFRDQTVHEGVSGTGSNKYFGENLQFTGAKKQWLAFRLKSPGAGKYALTMTNGTYSNGATVDIYFLKASVVDEALGENAAEYAEIMSQEPYLAGTTPAYSAITAAISAAIANAQADMTAEFVNGTATPCEYTFEADAEYIMVLNITGPDGSARILMNNLTATPVADSGEEPEDPENPENPENPEEPEEPEDPIFTEGVYDFYLGKQYGATLADSMETIAAKYDAGVLNWKYEAKHSSLVLSKVSYNAKMNSLYATSGKDWWLALRIKAPAEDGAYDIKMVHGAKGDGATAGSIFVIPGDTATNDILKVMTKTGAAFTTDWFYGEKTSDAIGGRESTTGSVNLRAGQEYIVVFMPTEKCGLDTSSNASFAMGQLSVTRTGDIVENEGGEGEDDGSIVYEFYDWDNAGNYLNHYKTEEELKKEIVTQEIADRYAAGTLNWCYQNSNGYGQFSAGTPYLDVTVGENNYYVLKIKSPGTGTYELTYNHYATASTKAALRGSMYIVPAEGDMDFNKIKGEADFKEAVISTTYYASKTTLQQSVGTYTAFEEGKEYFLCFSVEDDNTSKNSSLRCYPQSITMVRTGEYAPVAGEGGDYGTVYKLHSDDLTGKRHDAATPILNQRFANGTSNWKLEGGSGSATFNAKYVQFGTSKKGGYWAIRIKSPGTGMYRVTLHNMLGNAINAATNGEMYIFEAPETTIAGGSISDYAGVHMPVAKFGATTSGTRFVRASQSGEYGFVEGKEYIIAFYGLDSGDTRNTTNSTYFYIDRIVMQRTGDYVETEKAPHVGGTIAEDVVTEFKVGTQMTITMNDHDYLVLCIYGGTMLIYDLDEWRLVDEVDFSAVTDTPRTICIDDAGNWWITGATQSLFRYNPYTREGYNTGKVTAGGNNYEMVNGDDGYLYFGAYASTGLYLYIYDPVNLTYSYFRPEVWAKYPGAVKQKGDYIYTAVSGDGSRYEIWKVNKKTGVIVGRTDISHLMNGERYVNGMSWLGDEHLIAVTPKGWSVVDINTMEMMTQEEVGLRGAFTRAASEEVIDGKVYFVSNVEGVCYFDVETKTFGAVGGELANFKTGLRANCFLTGIEDTRLSEKSLITFGGMSADGLNMFALNLEAKTSATLIGLVEPGFGEGMNAHSIFKGAPGSNEIVYGPMYPDYPARVFNIQTGELAREFMTAGQNDSYLYYDGKMYFGNYTGANLTRMDDGQATKLFTLNDENFHQSRIHSLSVGDNKIFAGTVPGNFDLGGVIAWYDLETQLTYVVTGPNPEDVYYGKSSQASAALTKWYRATNDELIEDMSKEWDKDLDGDGVNQYFQGPIPLQSIIKVTYSDGLLYGYSCRRPGTGYQEPTHLSAQIFVYDVENMKMLKTLDLRDYIDGLPADPVRYISSLDADPDISNKCWGVICETLFSMTYDRDTNKVDIQVELSYGLGITSQTESIPHSVTFDGDYLYVLFGAKGGLRKINRYDISDNTLIMGDFERTSQVPSSFVLGDDGDIYYVSQSSPHIYVLNVDVTEEELAEAKAVQDIIDALPTEVTIADRDAIFAAREAWEAMRPANQPFVNNYDKLVDAEVALLAERIDALGEITIEDEEELVSIRTTYMGLKKAQRSKIDFMKVSEAESIMSILRGERTSALITALGEITLEDEAAVRAARASFMALSRYERTLVANIEQLNLAEAQLTGLILQRNEAAAVDKKIEDIGFVFFDNTKIKVAREAYDKLSDGAKEMVTKYDALKKAETLLIVEYVIAVLLIVGIAAVVVVVLIKKSSKKKAKAE